MPSVDVSGLTVLYAGAKKGDPPVTALDHFSAHFENGSINAILGPSGSGKTTLLKAMLGLLLYDGSVSFDGRKIDDLDTKDRDVSFVSQDYVLYPRKSVFDNIAFPLRVAGAGRQETVERVYAVAEDLGITYLLFRKPRQLSGGQQQRVALSRALEKRPPLLLLDEPFSNLDAQGRAASRDFLRDALRRAGVTTIYVTHSIEDATSLADRVYVLEKGRLVREGTPSSLAQGGVL